MIAEVLGARGILPGRLPLGLMLLMGHLPAVAAVIVAGLTGGLAGVRDLLGRLIIWRVGGRWYALAILGYALLCLGAVLLHNAMATSPLPLVRPEAAGGSILGLAANAALLFVVSALTNGEELAWRGFALPRLQARWSALTSSLVLGCAWALFHLPLFWGIGSSQAGMPPASFLLGALGLSLLYTWLFNNTRGSVLLATLLHAATNTWSQIFPLDHGNALIVWLMTALTVLTALIVVAIYGSARLMRRPGLAKATGNGPS
jgi:membrane protease YdiL (CAAX protease family)